MEEEDPFYQISSSYPSSSITIDALLTHVTARLGRHIFVRLCDDHLGAAVRQESCGLFRECGMGSYSFGGVVG
jgi:hypothetical protein